MSQIMEGKLLQTLEGENMRMKKSVMWDELTKMAVKLDGYESQALIQLMDEYTAMKNELCLKCGKYIDSHNGGCDGCRWRNES